MYVLYRHIVVDGMSPILLMLCSYLYFVFHSHFQGESSNFGVAKRLGLGGNLNLAIYENTVRRSDDCACFGFQPNARVVAYLNWAFRSSFLAVILSACFAFFFWTLLFAVVLMVLGYLRPDCLHVNGQEFGTTGADFLDAYALSWTTFSTVVSVGGDENENHMSR